MKRALLLLLLLAGCDLSMKRQPKTEPLEHPTLWPGGPPRRPPPAGTIAQDDIARAAALATPPPLTPALLVRGEERYGIFCAPCHGAAGDGNGEIVRRGFPAPPSFRDPALARLTPAQIVDVVTQGRGVMYSYADRVAPADRWAIAAHVKLLQRAGEAAQ